MITLYSGTPGSGKSFHLITVILRMLNKGRFVISNFPIKFTEKEKKRGYEERFFYVPNEEITIEYLIKFSIEKGMYQKKKESQCLVAIDEAGGRFNCRDFKNSNRAEWIDFFSQHRKLGYDFILVAQNDKMIDKQIRNLFEYEKKHRKINNFSIFEFLPFTVFVVIEYWYTIKQRLGAEFFMYRKSISNRYDSMKLFSGFKLSQEMLRKIENINSDTQEQLKTNINVIYTDKDEE